MFEVYNLKDNSFPVTPSDQNETPWFGFGGLKREFDTAFQRSASEHLRLCILNRGRLGAGKTHAARYYTKQRARRNIGDYARFIPIVIESPKQPQKAFIDFANRLLNAITFEQIKQASQNLNSLTDEKHSYKTLRDVTGSEDVAKVLSSINDANSLTSRVYLLGNGTAKELRELGVAKRLVSEHEFATAIIGVLYLLINGNSSEVESICRIILWMDEMEDLVYFPTRYYLPFTQALREVIDSTNNHLTLMLNFTFSEPEDLPAIENVLGQAIMQRVNSHIVFEQPKTDDLKDYILELLQYNRIDGKKVSPTFPFSEDALNLIIESSIGKTPRFMNKLCDYILRDLRSTIQGNAIIKQEISSKTIENKLPAALASLEEARG